MLRLAARVEVVDAENVVAAFDQPIAQVGAEEAGASGDEMTLHGVGSHDADDQPMIGRMGRPRLAA